MATQDPLQLLLSGSVGNGTDSMQVLKHNFGAVLEALNLLFEILSLFFQWLWEKSNSAAKTEVEERSKEKKTWTTWISLTEFWKFIRSIA